MRTGEKENDTKKAFIIIMVVSPYGEHGGDLLGEGGVDMEGVAEAPAVQVEDDFHPAPLGLRLPDDELRRDEADAEHLIG